MKPTAGRTHGGPPPLQRPRPRSTAGTEPGERLALETGPPARSSPTTQHAHHTPGQYVFIAVVLGVLTTIEIWLSYSSLSHTPQTNPARRADGAEVPALVVMYFMHLRFDRPVFRRLFVTGLLLALGVFIIVLLAEHADLNHARRTHPRRRRPPRRPPALSASRPCSPRSGCARTPSTTSTPTSSG